MKKISFKELNKVKLPERNPEYWNITSPRCPEELYAKKFSKIVKEYGDYKPKSPIDDAVNAARCHARLCSLECDMEVNESKENSHK